MNILSVENLGKSYGEKVLFDDLSFGIAAGEKIGLIGVNGTGKTTLLNVLSGIDFADAGRIAVGNHVKIGYLSQNPPFDDKATVLQQVFAGNAPAMQIVRDYEMTMMQLNRAPDRASDKEELQQELLELMQQMDEQDAWQLEYEAKMILTQLGIDDFDAIASTLSGGQRKRIALANALMNPVDLLILDEPTNHIDHETVDWLEQYLNKRKGALLMVTHDRYFLDRIVKRMIELDQGKLYSYKGNYSQFLEMKAEREDQMLSSEKKRSNLYRNELAWIRRGAQARSTKQKARIDRFEQLQGRKLNPNTDQIDISVGGSRLGKKVIELNQIGKGYADLPLIRDFDYIVLRDDRIGIIGPNGSGKSTLLQMIAGRIQPDQGTIECGQTVKVGCFFQESEEMDENLRVIEYIQEVAQVVLTSDGGTISAAQMLERFLFPPRQQWTPIAKLSGGEKRRLYLLRVLMSAPNVLLLDEPTNDLDIQTLTILEDYLDSFQGAVITVSHDRYFLDRVAEKIFSFEGNGRVSTHVGNYTEYQQYVRELSPVVDERKHTTQAHSINAIHDKFAAPQESKKNERPLKFTFKEQKEYEQIDDSVSNLEQELQAMALKMNEAGSDSVLLQQLSELQQQQEQQLEHLLERWTYLNELADRIESQTSK